MQDMINMRVAIIGLGRVGFSFGLSEKRVQPASHLACLSALHHKIAVCDSDPDKLAYASETIKDTGKAVYSDVSEMMREFKPEFVLIATPTPTHYDVVLNVASYSCVKAIFLEKPIAQSLSEAEEMVKVCANKGIRLNVNYTRRWSKVYSEVHRLIISDKIGVVKTIYGLHPGPLLRTGSHMLDLFGMFIDKKVQSVQAFGEACHNYLMKEDPTVNDFNINGVIRYVSGAEAVLLSGSEKPYLLFEVDIHGSKGRIRISDNGSEITVFQSHPSLRYDGINELQQTLFMRQEQDNMLLNAITQVTQRKPYGHIGCTGEYALKTLNIALALHYSAMHKNKLVGIDTVPKDYTIRSW